MSLLNFKTELKGRLMEIVIPKKKTVILRGSNADDIIYRIESLLSNDYRSYYAEIDKTYGFNYEAFEGESMLFFSTGSIVGKNNVVTVKGKIPNIHCIRYLGKGIFRSFININKLNSNVLNYDMTKYNSNISDVTWFRIVETVNNFIGKEIVDLKKGELRFNFADDLGLSHEAQKFIYLIIAECCLTPENASRVLLISDIEIMSGEYEAKLLECLDNIRGHSICLSSAKVEYNHFTSPAVTFLNV